MEGGAVTDKEQKHYIWGVHLLNEGADWDSTSAESDVPIKSPMPKPVCILIHTGPSNVYVLMPQPYHIHIQAVSMLF